MPTAAITDVIPVIKDEATQLRDFCAALTPEAWATPSTCAGWSVGDVFAHLTQGAQTWSAAVRRALAGDANPPAGEQPLRPGERGSEATAQRAIALHQAQGAAGLLQAFAAGHVHFDAVLQTVHATDWEKPCYHRRGTMSVRQYTLVRLQELAVHGWDIRAAFDPAATLFEPPLPWLLPAVQRWLLNTFRPLPALTALRRYRFETSGVFPVQHDVVVSQDGVRLEDTTAQQADTTFRCSTGDACLLIYGRLPLDRASAAGRVQILGDRALALLFPLLFQGV